MYSALWCQSWDESQQMPIHNPQGCLRDLGNYQAWEVAFAVRSLEAEALRDRWGPGMVVVTDPHGVRVDLHRMVQMN